MSGSDRAPEAAGPPEAGRDAARSLVDEVRRLIKAGRLESALDTLASGLAAAGGDADAATRLRGELEEARHNALVGRISRDEERLERSRIREAALVLARDPKPKRPASRSVFLSYNHGDADAAGKLRQALAEHGVDVRIDSEAMKPGEPIADFVRQSVTGTDYTLMVVSVRSLTSSWVAAETMTRFARESVSGERGLIACYLDEEFLKPRFRSAATREIDRKLGEIDREIAERAELRLDSDDLDDEKSRLHKLRNNLGEVLARLKNTLCLDIREPALAESADRIRRFLAGE